MKPYRPLYRTAMIVALCAITAGAALAGDYEIGVRAFMHRNHPKAKEHLLRAVQQSPSGTAYYFLGEIERTANNLDLATEYYQKAVQGNISPKFLRLAYWNLIILTEKRGNYTELVRSLKIFYEKTGSHGAREKAESIINKSIWSDNEEAVARYRAGLALKGKSADEAAAEFNKALTADSSFLAPKFELGMIRMEKGDSQGALSYFQEIASRVPFHGDAHLVVGQIHFERKSYRDAVFHFGRALEFSMMGGETRYSVYLRRGTSHFKLGDYEQAGRDLDRALSFKLNRVEPFLLMSAIQIKQEKYDDALRSLENARRLKPEHTGILYQMGSIYYRQNDSRYAPRFEELFEKVRSRHQTAPAKYEKAMEILAKKYFDEKKYQKAVQVLAVLPQERSRDMVRVSALSHYGARDYRQAIPWFEKMTPDAEGSAMLASAYARTGSVDKARSIVERQMAGAEFRRAAEREPELRSIIAGIERERAMKEQRERQERERLLKEQREREERERLLREQRERQERERMQREQREREERERLLKEQRERQEHGKAPKGADDGGRQGIAR